MKKKIFLILFLPLLSILYSFYNSPSKVSVNSTLSGGSSNKFLIGAIQSSQVLNDTAARKYYDSAGFNFTHIYNGSETGHYPGDTTRSTPFSWWVNWNEHLFDPVNADSIRLKLDLIYSHNQSKILFQRAKIEWLAFGQSSTYQCDSIANNDDYWFYAFNNHETGRTITDTNGAKVMYCQQGVDAAGFVVKRLKANTEQCSRSAAFQGTWTADTESDWYIKPKIRIDSSFVQNNPNDTVCKIYIKRENGSDTLFPILAKNFQKNSSSKYRGQYLEEFYFNDTVSRPIKFKGDLGTSWYFAARGTCSNDDNVVNKTDLQVKWSGNCNIWIDYVKVENDVAYDLLYEHPNDTAHQNRHTTYVNWITDEVNAIMDGGAVHPAIYSYYIELFEFNSIPCIAYVNKKIKELSGNKVGLMADQLTFYQCHIPYNTRGEIVTPEKIKRMYVDRVEPLQVFTGNPYPLTAPFPNNCYGGGQTQYCKLPETLPNTSNIYILGDVVSPNVYDTWLQELFDERCYWYQGGGEDLVSPHQLKGVFMYNMKHGDSISKQGNLPFIAMLQDHQWMSDFEVDREPTNEELDVMSNVAVTYGARGIIYWWYPSYYDSACKYGLGLVGLDNTPRNNIYGQPKWSKIKSIVSRVKKWEPYVMSFDNANRHSYIYRLEKSAMSSETFINDFKTKDTASHQDSTSSRYIQASVFNNDSAYTRYFMVVNRRCSPISAGNPSGGRNIEIKFNANSSSFGTFNNWKIIDLETDTAVATFDKGTSSYINLGWYNPGQGKLYKVVPVMIDGGTFVTDENLSNISFGCRSAVYTNGYNLTLEKGVNITFDSQGQIVMKKGSFVSGVSDVLPITFCNLKGQTGKKWYGLVFDSTSVNMNYTNISGVKPYEIKDTTNHYDSLNYGYALYSLNSNYVNVGNCNFNSDTTACIKIVYWSGTISSPTILINYDSLKVNSNVYRPVDIFSNSIVSGTFQITNNDIRNNLSGGGGLGIFIYGISHASVQNNLIRSFEKGIYSMHSSLDLWANVITNGAFGGSGTDLYGENYTTFDLSSNAGGFNTLNMFGGDCIYLDGSYVDIHSGGNGFSIYDSLGYHLRGYFPDDTSNTVQNGIGNCFTLHGNQCDSAHTKIHVILGNTTPVYYRLLSFNCPGSMMLADINQQDYSPDQKSKQTKAKNKKEKLSLPIKPENTFISGSSSSDEKEIKSSKLYTEMKIALKKNDYSLAAEKCKSILELGVENMYSVDAVRKLLHCVAMPKGNLISTKQTITKTSAVQSDSKVRNGKVTKQENTGSDESSKTLASNTLSSMSDLKSYYESYIQSHPENKIIINEMFYYIIKCKINLGEYESALSGYKAIREKNPSSMAGLNAKWEYNDLQLLIASKRNGTGGGESELSSNNEQLTDEQQHGRLVSFIEGAIENNDGPKDGKDDKDKNNGKKITKEERKVITNNIVKSLETNDQKDKIKLKSLEEKVINNQADQSETAEYKKMVLLRELIKIQKITNTNELIDMIQSDLRRILALDHPAVNEQQMKTAPEIVYDYKLNQNYPNPFNPTTKINYELKNAGFVSLKIYDLLGREITELVNETKDAGRYTVDFNASKYMMSSGIYFYRIKAGEFVDTKRMVLVK
ncbi:MAG: T9SS type A sorting domain-containing protein [Ignavibacteria bacterium]|nr:T9SS type A sorting domain-containing protein [Ignavibacteria bacterium]